MYLSVKSVCIVGGAGFIGSHIVEYLLTSSFAQILVIDDLSSGGIGRIEPYLIDPRVTFQKLDARDLTLLTKSLLDQRVDLVIHLASNPDIAAAMEKPTIDFERGTLITQSVVEASRLAGVQTVLYASGSGVYGDYGLLPCVESTTLPRPISTYGASKLAGESMLSAYANMCGLRCLAFRFGNVVGHRATHGVYYDFVNRLYSDPTKLHVRGNGNQSKSYVYINDVISAVFTAEAHHISGFDVFNVATDDYVSVREIAEMAIEIGGLERSLVRVTYEESERGWAGDVPIVRLSSDKLRALGWRCRFSSRKAIQLSLTSRWQECRA